MDNRQRINMLLLRIKGGVEFFEIENQDDEYRDGDAGIGDVEYRTEEDHFAGTVANQRAIEHVYHAAVHPTGIAE